MARTLDARTLDLQVIAEAADALAAGELVAFPTETVYGLGARADSAAAVARIFAAKGRPSDHPLIVHVADAAGAEYFAASLPPVARRLMAAFWPGPVSLIVPRRAERAAAAAGGQTSVGLRCPSHPVAHALLVAARERGVPGVAAPSANRFGQVSPSRAAHVASEFPDLPALCLLDGGACEVGIESAIIDCSRGYPVLLRPGSVSLAALAAAAGEPVRLRDAAAPRASGTLASHYAPRARLRLFTASDWPALAAQAGALQARNMLGVYSRSMAPDAALAFAAQPQVLSHLWPRMPDQPDAAAHELFAMLRSLDALGVAEIWVEAPPADSAWDGVRDRLQRAAAS